MAKYPEDDGPRWHPKGSFIRCG